MPEPTEELVNYDGAEFAADSPEARAAEALKGFFTDGEESADDPGEMSVHQALFGDDDEEEAEEELVAAPEAEEPAQEVEAQPEPEKPSSEALLRSELEELKAQLAELRRPQEPPQQQRAVDPMEILRNPAKVARDLGLSRDEMLALGESVLLEALGDEAPPEYRQRHHQSSIEARLEQMEQQFNARIQQAESKAFIVQYQSGLQQHLGNTDAEYVAAAYARDPKGTVQDLLWDAKALEEETGQTPSYEDVVKYHNDKIANFLNKYQPAVSKPASSHNPQQKTKVSKTLTQSQSSATPPKKTKLTEEERIKRATAAFVGR